MITTENKSNILHLSGRFASFKCEIGKQQMVRQLPRDESRNNGFPKSGSSPVTEIRGERADQTFGTAMS
jgi:hypothetical protein